jgi:hypothetical protein
MAKANGRSRELQGWDNVFPAPQPATDVTQLAESATTATREVESAVLSDGRMIDLVRCARQPQNVEFLVWQDRQIRRTSFIEHDSERLIIPKLDATVISALRLPTMVEPCPPVRELFLQLIQQIETYVPVSKEHNFLTAAFTLSSWFADRQSIVPYLSVGGPPDSGQANLLRLLHCLCRRALHAADVTPASLYRLSAQVRPTWLIEEADFSNRRLQRLLRGGNHRRSVRSSTNRSDSPRAVEERATGSR